MPIAIADFWKLTVVSGLLSANRVRELQSLFAASPGADTDPVRLAQWLVGQNVLTRYQASVLLTGRPGPFVLGDFVIRDRLEQGRLQGMFRARYKEKHSLLLIFLAQLTDSGDAEALLGPHVQAAAALQHPHISRTHRLIARGAPFVVVQDLQGQSLREWLAMPASVAPESVTLCRMLRDVSRGLAEMHARRRAHGNLSLDTIWVQPDESALLLQFPLNIDLRGKLPAAEEYAVEEGPILTAQMSQDVTAVGAALFEALTKQPAHAAVTPLSQCAANIPPGLGRLVDGLLGGHPYTAAQFAKALDDFTQADIAVSTPEDDDAIPETDWVGALAGVRPKPATARRVTASTVGVVALLTVATALGYWMFSSRSENVPAADATIDQAVASQRQPAQEAGKQNSPAQASNDRASSDSALVTSGSDTNSAPTQSAAVEVDDDGQTLWASPTHGTPLSFDYVPPGARVFALRFRDLLAQPEAERLLDALGPAGDLVRQQLPAVLGVPLQEIEQLIVAFYCDDADALQTAYVISLSQPQDVDKLRRTWQNPQASEHQGKTFFESAQLAYYLPSAAEDGNSGQTIVIAPRSVMKTILEQEGPPPLPTVLAQLARASDRTRHITLLFTPSFLFTDGRALWAEELASLRDPFRQFLGEEVQAGLLSAQLGERLFLELRAMPVPGTSPQDVAQHLREREGQFSERVEEFVATHDFQAYGRMVLNRLPQMLQAMSHLTRSGVEARQAVLRCYLPSRAAHNLVLGTQLALTQAGTTSQGPTSNSTPAVAPPLDASAALRRTISLSFPRESLENCLELLAREIGVEIKIIGADFQSEGITRNQSLNDFDQRDQSAEAILRKLLQRANPEGKLVYVLKPSPSGVETIYITTRGAAAARKDRVPAEFSEKTPPKSP